MELIENKINKRIRQELHQSKFGYQFDLYGEEWVVGGSCTINLNRLRTVDETTEIGFRRTLCRYAEELSPYTTRGMIDNFNNYLEATKEQSVNLLGLTNYRASLGQEDEHQLGKLKAFLLAWYDWGFKGIDKDCVDYLEELTLKGREKGKAVKYVCPYSGPLTHNELGALLDWASNAFSIRQLSISEYAYFMVLALTGRRSVQIRALRGRDLIAREDSNGNDYIINCPRAKQMYSKFREHSTLLPINEDLYLILKNKWNESVSVIEGVVGSKLPDRLKKEVPLFLEMSRVVEFSSVNAFEAKQEKLPDYFHMSLSTAMELLQKVSGKNTARSERTGEFINFTSRRFRYTKGTNLSRRGISGVALAAALDHSDTQHVGVYTQNTEETAEQISEIMSPVTAPLAQAFDGSLITSERDAIRANDPHSRVKNGKANNVGSCGTYSFCASGFRACYTCVNFQPWQDAPHEEVLEEILEERERQRKNGVSQFVIAASDRLLLAVQQVIQLCQKAKITAQKSKEVLND